MLFKTITKDNFMAAGELIVKTECLACHTLISGGRNSIPDILEGLDAESAFYLLDDLARTYMPPFVGSETEKRAAAAFIADISGGELPTGTWVIEGE